MAITRFGLLLSLSLGCAPTPVAPSGISSAPPAAAASPPAEPLRDAVVPPSPAATPVLVPGPGASTSSMTPKERLDRHHNAFRSPRHRPKVLDEAARPARLAAGAYACRVSREYRLRNCSVEQDAAGRTMLEFSAGNLIGMRGVVTDSGGALEFEGWLTEEQPFGCSHCADRCIEEPGSCACDELPEAAVSECVAQPLRVTLRPNGPGRYRGRMPYRVYYNEYVGEGAARRPEGFVAREEQFEIDLVHGAPPVGKD